MNYSAMIQNRKSVRAFRGKEVPNEALAQLRTYYEKTCPRLVPEIATELIVLDKDAQPALESSAGYQQFLIGAPHYLLLMSARHIHAGVNARDEKSRTFSSNSKRSHILRTSSRSRRLILSSIVSFAVWLKWTRTI